MILAVTHFFVIVAHFLLFYEFSTLQNYLLKDLNILQYFKVNVPPEQYYQIWILA